jgi:hypothetical protein
LIKLNLQTTVELVILALYFKNRNYFKNQYRMKKHVLIGAVLLAAISAFPQSGRMKPKLSGIIDTRILAQSKFGLAEEKSPDIPTADNTTIEEGTVIQQPALKSSVITNTWQAFTASMNAYGTSVPYTKPLQWNDDLNAISFLHRKSPTYAVNPTPASNAENGAIVAMISVDCGATWDSTAIWANDTYWGRFPGGAIYNPPSTPVNTDINNAYIVGAGPTTGNQSTTWIGNWYASKPLGQVNYDNSPSMVTNAQQVMPTIGPYSPNLGRHDFSAYSFTGTDDGKMRVLAGITDDGLASDSAIMLVTGTFNSTSSTFDWAGTVFNPPVTLASDQSKNLLSRPMMAWNESGTHGYVVLIGVRAGSTQSNEGIQPIVYKTVNSGATWTLENGINFNSSAFAGVKRSLTTVKTDTTLEVPWFNFLEGMDCAIDANNKLHIFANVVGAYSNHPDSVFFLSQWGTEGYHFFHQPGFRPYLYDFIYDGTATTPAWSYLTVDSMSSEAPGLTSTSNGYQDNPWDGDPNTSNQKLNSGSYLHMSRTPDGQFLVYTWSESDTTLTNSQKKWNSVPDIKARILKVSTGVMYPTGPAPAGNEIDVTGTAPGSIAHHAMFHFTSPKCKISSTVTVNGGAPVISLPMTVTNSSPYHQLTTNKHWFSWVTLNPGNVPDNQISVCAAVTVPTNTVGVAENVYSSASGSYVFPNPAKNSVNVSVNLVNNSKIQIDVLNAVGQVVRSAKADGQNGINTVQVDVNGLASGIYMVNVKVDNASSTKKLVIE